MKVPLSWLKEYVDIDIDPKKLADELTMSGSKVEAIEEPGKEISNVVVGKVLTLEKHPDADKLQVSKVDIGDKVLQIVTGASNIKAGDIIPIAKHGARLPGGKKISKGKLRGVDSEGMMCSIQELGMSRYDYPEASEHGIFILNWDVELGRDITDVLGINDAIIEFEITPNRPDCLSIIGIARETAVTFGKQIKKDIEFKSTLQSKKLDSNAGISIEIQDCNLCRRYAGRVVKNIRIGSSPEWMRERLRNAGMRPINNIVDVTNYVMLELGQPMHAFDFNKVEGKKIIVRRAKEGEVLATLDDQERKLTAKMLVIADENKPLAVAGVMGGANSEVNENTTTILLESANFTGSSVRLTAKALGLRTEASARFEKGLDIENTIRAMNRAVQLLEEMGAGIGEESYVDCYPVKWEQKFIKFRPEKVNQLLGTNIDTRYMISVFEALGLKVDETNMNVTIPSYRQDIEGEADLAEEVARFYGYNNIVSTLFSGETTQGGKTFKQKIEDTCKSVMNAQGLSEIYTYSFVSPRTLDMINANKNSNLRNTIEVANPLSEEHKIMRTTTVPSMLEVLARNYSRRIPAVRLYELAYAYIPKVLPIAELPEERELLTIGMYGEEDFYSIKGVIEELLTDLGIKKYEFVRCSETAFHSGRTAEIRIGDKKIGIVGEIHADVLENYGLNTRAYVGVVEVQQLIENANVIHKYKQLPKHPALDRDIAMVVKDEIAVREIEAVIKFKGGNLLEELKLFDVYKGEQIAKGYKSVAYALSFRATDRTLTYEEVNGVMKKIMDGLKEKFEAQLR